MAKRKQTLDELSQTINEWISDVYLNLYSTFDETEVCDQGLLFAQQLQQAGRLEEVFDGNTILSFACGLGLEPLVESLLSLGANVNGLADHSYDTHPAYSTFLGHTEGHLDEETLMRIWERLDLAGAQWDYMNKDGSSLIHFVSRHDSIFEPLEFLLDHGVDPSLPDQFGSTPLHHALSQSNDVAAHLLLDRGAGVLFGKDQAAIKSLRLESIIDIVQSNLPYEEDLIEKIQTQMRVEQERDMLEAETPRAKKSKPMSPKSL